MNPIRSLALVVAPLVTFACADLTAPASSIKGSGGPPPTEQARDNSHQAERAEPAEQEQAAKPAPQQQEAVAASHILVSYKGALRAKPEVTRTKEEAKQRAEQLLAALKKGGDFADVAKKESDGPSSVRGGALGKFTRDRMVKPFADAAFALKPGELSEPVETQFGFHVIKRTE